MLSQRRTAQQADQLLSVRGDVYQPDGGWGHAYGMYALLREDRAAAGDALGRAAVAAGHATGFHGMFWAPWALLSLLEAPPEQPVDIILDQP